MCARGDPDTWRKAELESYPWLCDIFVRDIVLLKGTDGFPHLHIPDGRLDYELVALRVKRYIAITPHWLLSAPSSPCGTLTLTLPVSG